eukprot:SAG11_NODE_1184_length_5591_cov_3.538420_1_plen_80_part_00
MPMLIRTLAVISVVLGAFATDPNCVPHQTPGCVPTSTDAKESGALCFDGLDNDCDGLSDCCDPDCQFGVSQPTTSVWPG